MTDIIFYYVFNWKISYGGIAQYKTLKYIFTF